ncbi:MAG: hypothetical protein E7Z70_06930 [Thermoplasmata archaeon]|nr:hypothetical protein [Thermoplasmata archaeon]
MFSQRELESLYYLSRGCTDVGSLAEAMNISNPETYRIVRNLKSKDVLKKEKPLAISNCAFAKRLFYIMSNGPEVSRFFSDSRLDVLKCIMTAKDLGTISKETGISESHIHKILNIHTNGGIVRNINGYYSLNDNRYPQIRKFLESLIDHLEVNDAKLPDNSLLLFRKNDAIIYSTKEKTTDNVTGFTALEKYGLTGWVFDDVYCTTEYGELSLEEIFNDALKIAEHEDSTRLRMAAELFYMKNEDKLNPPKEFVDIHNRILSGERIERWPSLQDLNDRLWTVEG